MKIYHYTNIEEGNAESWGVKFCKYVFVSCWTDIKEENIPLWKMYSGDTGGIRIALEQEMFKEYLIANLKIESLQSKGSMISKISPQDMLNPNFFIIPIQDYENDLFYRHLKSARMYKSPCVSYNGGMNRHPFHTCPYLNRSPHSDRTLLTQFGFSLQ